MRLVDRIKGWQVLFSFDISMGDMNDVAVKVTRAQPGLEDVELVRFFAFMEARIVYEIGRRNPPQSFHALNYVSRIVERLVQTTTHCLSRAGLPLHRCVIQVEKSVEQMAGQYLGRRDAEWKIHFAIPPAFEGNEPHPLAMVAGAVLFQHVLGAVKETPWIQQALCEAARTLARNFGRGKWSGRRSIEDLPQAAFVKATLTH